MINQNDVAAALSLTGVTLTVEGGRTTITADQPVTAAQQAQVQAWHDAGAVNAVHASVTPLQMRRALRATGLKAIVDAALAAQSEEVREEWEFASEVRRDNATLNALGQSLGKSPADLDALFQLAATL